MQPGARKRKEQPEAGQDDQQQPKQAAHENHDPLALPTAWEKCPCIGYPIKGHRVNFIPSKVPLANHFADAITPGHRYNLFNAFDLIKEAGHEVGMVVDLTNTSRFYDAGEWNEFGNIEYVKIRCRGRGEVPEPEAVNWFYWRVAVFTNAQDEMKRHDPSYQYKCVLVHCTHGFNRTGYMIVNYLVRQGHDLTKCIETFAKCRPPGIYKDDYLKSLYTYYHERRGLSMGPASDYVHLWRSGALTKPGRWFCQRMPGLNGYLVMMSIMLWMALYLCAFLPTSRAITPAEPSWKKDAPPSPERDLEWDGDAPEAEAADGDEKPQMHHDDPVGEAVCEEEALSVQRFATTGITGMPPPETWANLEEEAPLLARYAAPDGSFRFAGSQPVSLARSNTHLLRERRYFATWKADGTRFLLLIFRNGAYLLDRSMQVRRVQMRCPNRQIPYGSPLAVGAQQHNTLLDGEMVVDIDASGVQRRRFLAYDIMTLNGQLLTAHTFEHRFGLLHKEIEGPRDLERAVIASEAKKERSKRRHAEYDYGAEMFSIRRKNFWPMTQVRKLLDSFIPNLSHESDGLIFQGYEDPYIPGTCEQLLKWKFAHLNSVDFLLRIEGVQAPELLLMKSRGQGGLKALPGAKIYWPDGQHPGDFKDKIIECSWGGEEIGWTFMRVRTDKSTPNAWHVYEKVFQSICDDIGNESLLHCINESIQVSAYDADRLAAENAARLK